MSWSPQPGISPRGRYLKMCEGSFPLSLSPPHTLCFVIHTSLGVERGRGDWKLLVFCGEEKDAKHFAVNTG